jgi:hypothetical protein
LRKRKGGKAETGTEDQAISHTRLTGKVNSSRIVPQQSIERLVQLPGIKKDVARSFG